MNKYQTRWIGAFLTGWLLPIHAQNTFEVNILENDNHKTVVAEGINFVRHGQAERYAWKPASSPATSYGAQGRAFDISRVKSVRRRVEHTSKMTLPKGCGLSMTDVVVLGDRDNISHDAQGEFKTVSAQVTAMTKEGKPLYNCWASADSVIRSNQADLNAIETAIATLLPLFPFVGEQTDDKYFRWQKDMLRALDETQTLAKAIDASISKHGYLMTDDIVPEIDAACRKVHALMGLETALQSRPIGRYRMPKPPTLVEGVLSGMEMKVNKSEWVYSEKWQKNVWRCTFTANNYNRLGFTGIIPGYMDQDGKGYVYDDDNWYEHVRYLVEPQRVSKFMEHFKAWDPNNWDKVAEFIDQTIIHPKPISETTWDMIQLKNIQLDFPKESDGVFALSSRNDNAVLIYNLVQLLGKPILGTIYKKIKNPSYQYDFTSLEDYIAKKIILDAKFLSKITLITANPDLSDTQKRSMTGIAVLEKLKDFVKTVVIESAQSTTEMFLWQKIGSSEMAWLMNEFDSTLGMLKKIEKYGDYAFGFLGLLDRSAFYKMNLDFKDTGIIVPNVPGTDM